MRIELLPVLLGVVAAVMGGLLVLDAIIADGTFISVERRRSSRPPRSRTGEGLVGAAIMLIGASLIGLAIGQAFDGTVVPMQAGYLLCGLFALAAVLTAERGRLFRPHEGASAQPCLAE